MRRITAALLAWTVVWIVVVWAIDPASTADVLWPAELGLSKPSTWVLFEIWAVGFVVLGWIWNRVPAGTTDQARFAGRSVRRMTRVILGWTALWIGLFVTWAFDPGLAMIGDGPIGGAAKVIRHKPLESQLLDEWFLGFLILGVMWVFLRWWSALHQQSSPETW